MSLADKIKQQEAEAKKAGIAENSSNFFKFSEGSNVIRVLTEPELIFEKFKTGICYTGCGYQGAPRFMCYVEVREKNIDNQEVYTFKIAKLPYKVGTQIAAYEQDPEYTFDGYPMPYRINVNATNAGTKEVDYSVIPSRNNTDADPAVLQELAKAMPITEIIEKMKQKTKEKHMADGTFQAEQVRQEEIRANVERAKKGLPVIQADAPELDPNASVLPEYPEGPNPEDIAF